MSSMCYHRDMSKKPVTNVGSVVDKCGRLSRFCCCRSPFKTGQLRASRLSKAGFDFRFQKLANETGNLHLIDTYETYADKKQAAMAYFTARARLFDYLKTAQYGQWQSRPDELEAFTTECR